MEEFRISNVFKGIETANRTGTGVIFKSIFRILSTQGLISSFLSPQPL